MTIGRRFVYACLLVLIGGLTVVAPAHDAMTLEDAQRVIRQYFPLDNLVFVVIGKAAEIGPVVRK